MNLKIVEDGEVQATKIAPCEVTSELNFIKLLKTALTAANIEAELDSSAFSKIIR